MLSHGTASGQTDIPWQQVGPLRMLVISAIWHAASSSNRRQISVALCLRISLTASSTLELLTSDNNAHRAP
jgi:hypothetical protein